MSIFTISSAADGTRLITPLQLESLGNEFTAADVTVIHTHNPKQWSQKLAEFEPNQQVWLKQQWLQQLAQLSQTTREQQNWVAKQLTSRDVLKMASPDHPNRHISIINIGQQAKATQLHWQINQAQVQFNHAWHSGQWDWQNVLPSDDWVIKKALHQWLMNLSPAIVEQVAESYRLLGHHLPIDSNQLLATLAKQARAEDLYQLLWQRPTDEFSFQALAHLPAVLDVQQGAQVSIAASQNKALSSQAYFLLAVQYGHLSNAQQTLLEALSQPSQQWLVAAVLGKVEDRAFVNRLQSKLGQLAPSRFRQHSLKMLAENQQRVEQ